MGLHEIIERANKAIENSKKLTTKQRKKLKKGTFCGKNRSFPVNDCSHYTAALRMLNRAKLSSGEKARVKACIIRRGKELGCSGAGNKEESSYLTLEMQKLYDSEEFALTKAIVEASIIDPGKDLDYYLAQVEDM